MVDVANLCMGCMEQKGAGPACPLCGFREGSAADSPLHLTPRTELHGQYLVGRVLGHGGFGITYLGWDLNLERKIAIKEYLPSGVAVRTGVNSEVIPFSGEMRKDFEYGLERYLDEARTVARFQTHPTVVSVLNFFRDNGTAYLVMEYLEGATFERFLENNGGKTAIDTIFTVMVPVIEALGAVHQQGILHRDISPDNIYITRKWQIKVLDFGAARYALGQKSRNLSVILKEGYAPVEQYHSKGNQGPWTDVYGCGATIYRALSGKVPPASLDRMQGDDIQLLSALGVEILPDQERALMKALAVQPDARFHTMQAFRDALTGVSTVEAAGTTGEKIPAAAPISETQVASTKPVSALSPPRSGSPPLVRPPISEKPHAAARPISRKPPRTALPKWVWAAAAGMMLAVGGISYKQYHDRRQAIGELRQDGGGGEAGAAEAKAQAGRAAEALREADERRRLLQQQTERQERERAETERQNGAGKPPVKDGGNSFPQTGKNSDPQSNAQNPFAVLRNQIQGQAQSQTPTPPRNQPPQNLTPQSETPPPSQDLSVPKPSQPNYEDMMRQAFQMSRASNYPAAMQLSQQAARVNPGRPEAYSNMGWIALYGSGDLQTATANYREAIHRGGIVWVRVNHDHSNLTFQIHCTGDLGIAEDRIEFAAHNRQHNFRLPRNAIKEMQNNKFNPFKPMSGDFHIKDKDGRNYNLISVTSPKAVRDMIMQLAKLN